MTERNLPLSFSFEITSRCNNNCRHCYVNAPQEDPRAESSELTRADIARIAGEAANMGAMWCLLTGGEPLLRQDFSGIYLDLRDKGLLVSVFTNATLVTEEHLELFRHCPPRDVEVSVYGVTRDTYERVTRAPGSFDAFTRGLDRLFNAGIKVRLKAMALRSNIHEFPRIAHFCRENTKDFFRFDPQIHMRFDGDARRNQEIRSERLTAGEIVGLETADTERWEAMRKECREIVTGETEHSECGHLFRCGAGKQGFYVSHDGQFRLCASLCHPGCVYDLKRGSLADAWRNHVPKVRAMTSRRPEFLKTCHVCPIVNLCMWCPAHGHLETGELDRTDEYFCATARARATAVKQRTDP